MKQKTRIASKLFAALVVLTLISCCFLGTTFARYTTGDSGVAKVEVAKWNVSITGAGVQDGGVTFNNAVLSPDNRSYEEAQEETGNTERVHSTAIVEVATIRNNSEVSADVKFTPDTSVTYAYGNVDGVTNFSTAVTNWGTLGRATDINNESMITKLIQITYYEDQKGTNELEPGEMSFTLEPDAAKTIYASVSWVTDDTYSATDAGVKADDLDTFVGMYVTSASWNLSVSVVQASELPKPSTP